MRIDLDAARAARREAAGEGPVVIIGGKEIACPAELPFEVADCIGGLSEEAIREDPIGAGASIKKVLDALLGDAQEEFMKQSPSIDDILALLDGLLKSYGLEDLGESQASAAS